MRWSQMRIEELYIKQFKNLRDLRVNFDKGSPYTVLVGGNGSGKSNLIEAIRSLRASVKEWRDVLRKGGGVNEWIWKGDTGAMATVEWIVQRP